MAGQFDLDKWAEEFELSAETLKIMADKGFNSLKTISKLSPDIIKKELKGLSVAQSLMLQDGVDSLQPQTQKRQPEASVSTERSVSEIQSQDAQTLQQKLDTGNNLTIADLMAMLGTTKTKEATPQELPGTGKALIFDPLLQLQPESGGGKTRDIRDYIASHCRDENSGDRSGTITVGSVELAMKNSKIPLDKVTISQYMEASLRILRAMVAEDGMQFSDVMNYVGYLVKISTLAQNFRWEQVLKYDQEYRKAQTELGFAWGADNSYLMQVYLKSHVSDSTHNWGKSRPSYNKPSARYTPSGSGSRRDLPEKFDPASGKAICQKFNGRAGCQWPTCRYAHVCMTCHDKNHRDVDHKDSTKNA